MSDNKDKREWPRIQDLPEEERFPFAEWLYGQTCPWVEGVPADEQDAYYPWDYQRWKRKWPVID